MPGPEVLVHAGGFAIALSISIALTALVRRLAFDRGWLDRPNQARKIHEDATPTMGGVAIVGGVLAGLAYFAAIAWWGRLGGSVDVVLPSDVILVGALTLFAVGIYDDLEVVSYEHKFMLQVVVASIVIHDGLVIEYLPIPFVEEPLHLDWLGVPLTLIWIVGLVNAVNFLDGMDGLAAGVSLIAFGSLAAAYSVTGFGVNLPVVLVVSGALAGFLYHNFHPASIFMGDCGSLFVGFLLATYSLAGPARGHSMLAFLIPVLALGVPVVDTLLAVVRRYLRGTSVFQADDDHIHHRLRRLLHLDHRQAVLVLYGMGLLFGVFAFGVAAASNWQLAVVVVAAATTMYGILRTLRYFRIRDLPWLIRQRDEFRAIRRGIEEGTLQRQGAGERREDLVAPPHVGAAAQNGGSSHPRRDGGVAEPDSVRRGTGVRSEETS